LLLAVFGSIAVLIFLSVFGFRLLIGFSLLVERLRGSTKPAADSSQTVIFPPVLDPLPMATKSGTLAVTGSGQAGMTLVMYLNDQEMQHIDVTKSGTFKTTVTNLKDGLNTISAKLTDNKGNLSDLSNVLSVTIKQKQPTLELTSPGNGTTILGDNNLITVSGKTDDNTTVTVNGRIIVVRADNTFSYSYPLNQGSNTLTVVATDEAGNTITAERSVSYQK
jgi:hypothetical protein